MKRSIILGAVWVLAVARPELYKEKEDFQYSRSSSDDGSKSGFYGAQRGNMGGNYERAHNMDSLAQNQMSGLVRQVQGELGDGAKMRAGSVYTAANSRGTYGSGHFDLSNLEGRNFQEGTSYGDSQSLASQSSSSAYNAAGYTNSQSQNSRHSGYQAVVAGSSGVNVPSDNLQSLDNLQGTGQYDYGRQSSHSSGYNAQSGFQKHSEFDTSNANTHYGGGYGSNTHTRLISATPVRIIVRPGTRVAIPVAAQTYDISRGSSSLVDQNSLKSDAEILTNDNQRTLFQPGGAKSYESSYNYRKEWEKHDTVPTAVTLPTTRTENPFPKNSELYEDNQARTAGGHYGATRVDSQRAQSNTYGGYNVKSGTSQSRSAYDTQHHLASLNSNTNAYTLAGHNTGFNNHASSSDSSLSDNIQSQYSAGSRYHAAAADSNSLTQAGYNTGFNANLNSQVENLNGKPKSYQSSYSYHKSWEHQGDPYVIKPASTGYYDGQSAQILTTGSTKNQAYAATGSHYQHSHQSGADCDENGHIRVARSYNTDQYQDTQQQSQNLEGMQQQAQDLSQQSQNQWQEVGQQSQNTWDNLENLSQQSHNQWDKIQNEWDQFEDPQTVINSWGQEPQSTNNQLEDLTQKSHNDLGQHIQDIGVGVGHEQGVVQQAQDKWDFSNIGQHGQENYQNQNYHYEKSHKFNHQENQHDLKEFEIFNHSQQSRRHNYNKQDKISVWDQGLVNGDIEQKSQNSMSQSDKPSQFKSDNIDDETLLELLTSNTQQTYKFPGTYDPSNKHFSSDRIPPNTVPLFSLWNKIDNIEQQSTSSDNSNISEGNNFSQVYTSLNSYQNSRQEHTNDTDSTVTQYHYNQIKPHPEYQVQVDAEDISQNNLNNTQADKENPQDLGRGDIGPEDMSDIVADKKKANTLDTSVSENTKQNSNNTIEKNLLHPSLLSVSGLNPENSHVYKNIENNVSNASHINSQNIGLSNSPTQLQHQDKNLHQQSSFNLQQFGQENMQNFDQVNSDQQDNLETFGQHENLGQQNLQDFGQHENLDQQNLQEFEQHESLQQQNLEPNLQDFGQQANLGHLGQQENLEQENFQNVGQTENQEQHNLQDFGKHENLEHFKQENLEQKNLHNFGQQENLEQQNLQNFGQHENLAQQNVQDFGQHENLEQQNLQDFGQQANLEHIKEQNLEQQNIQNFEQENVEQQNLQNFGQHENLAQQNLQDFGQHENLEQQNLQDFGQQANLEHIKDQNLEQQNLQHFGQQENIEQQNLQNFGQHENLAQQNLQDFGQHKNLEQQNLQDFGQQENLDQQNLQNFGQQENLDQQNLQNFGQQENLEQQNLQDFGQHENLEQQNLRDFAQQANLEHFKEQNLEQQNFGQQENLGQQNLQNFGQQENLEQQNLQNFGQQENLEQQNLQDFGQHENLEQQYTNAQAFEQKSENLDKQNPLKLEQLTQSSKPNNKYTDKLEQQTYRNNNRKPQIDLPKPEEIEENIQVQKQNNDLQSIPVQSQNTVSVLPIEPVTEKPGFWKSVGNKFSSAKSKIESWFKH